MKNEGALRVRFFRHNGIYRSDVSSHLLTLGRGSRFPVEPVPGFRTRRKEHALPIVRDEFRPAIPRRGARQHCPSPLHRHHQLKSIAASSEIIYHPTVTTLLTVCLGPGDNPKITLEVQSPKRSALKLCLIGVHSWNGCKCSACGKTRYEGHTWDGCICSTCGETRHTVNGGDKCSACGAAACPECDGRGKADYGGYDLDLCRSCGGSCCK